MNPLLARTEAAWRSRRLALPVKGGIAAAPLPTKYPSSPAHPWFKYSEPPLSTTAPEKTRNAFLAHPAKSCAAQEVTNLTWIGWKTINLLTKASFLPMVIWKFHMWPRATLASTNVKSVFTHTAIPQWPLSLQWTLRSLALFSNQPHLHGFPFALEIVFYSPVTPWHRMISWNMNGKKTATMSRWTTIKSLSAWEIFLSKMQGDQTMGTTNARCKEIREGAAQPWRFHSQ